jgi:hypothetical protein
MLPGPGPDLDHLVARRLGDSAPEADYSVDPTAADRLIARLETSGLLIQWERADELWYCTLAGRAAQRLATGSGTTRELALCRAVSHLPADAAPGGADPCGRPAGRTRRKRVPPSIDSAPIPAAQAKDHTARACEDCGAPLPRVRALSRICSVCSYRRDRQARIDFEARRRNRRRRPPAAG